MPAPIPLLKSRNLVLTLMVATVSLGIYTVYLRNELAAARNSAAAARTELQTARQEAQTARAESEPIRENVARLTVERDQLRENGTTPATSGTSPANLESGLLSGFAQSFATPEMKQMVHRESLNDARKGFADLLKRWKLPPSDAEQFLQFVAERETAETSDALAMLADGKLNENTIAEQEKQQAKRKEESNARLKALLGEQRFTEFETFDARKTELATVSSYRDHLEAAGIPLADEQRTALAKIVKAEKQDEDDWSPEDVEFFTKGMTDEQLAKIRRKHESAYARIEQQASAFLSPDQVSALQSAFHTEADDLVTALKLVRNMMQPAAQSK